MLHITTTEPSKINDALRGSLPASFAAIGAAMTPPITRARITCQFCTPIRVKNVNALATVIKNSVRLTEPTTYLGVLPLVINVEVRIGPQPPLPNESRKHQAPDSQRYLINLFLLFMG